MSGTIPLPDRVTVLTCIGCGGMGRQERCDGACTERKLVLVGAAEHEELPAATDALREVAEAFAAAGGGDPAEELTALRDRARRALRAAGPSPEPDTVTGWWCDRCGNVDLPQPCIGVCVWRPAEWVNVAVYERDRAAELRRFLARAAAVSPRAGQWERNRRALRAQARAALADVRLSRPRPAARPRRAARRSRGSARRARPRH